MVNYMVNMKYEFLTIGLKYIKPDRNLENKSTITVGNFNIFSVQEKSSTQI